MGAKLSSHIEDYLETITMLQRKNKVVRARDISRRMGVSMPSVCSAIKILVKKGLVTHERYGYIELTREGKLSGEKIYNCHKILIKFLRDILNTHPATAEKDACRIEHGISRDTIKRLVAFVKFIETCPYPEGRKWLKSFNYFYRCGKMPAGYGLKLRKNG